MLSEPETRASTGDFSGLVGKLARGNVAFGERLVVRLAEAGADQVASMLSASLTGPPAAS